MLVFFSLINQAKSPFRIHGHLIPPYSTSFGQNLQKVAHDQTYIFFNISLLIITQNAPINSLTYIFNPSKPFQSHMKISIIHSFGQNLHNTHL